MPSLDQHQSNDFTKMLLMGDSGSGKTGALASLVEAGYRLNILDFDNGLDVLKQFVGKEHQAKLRNVNFRTLRDRRKATGTGFDVVKAEAFPAAIKMLDRWKYKEPDGTEVDLGNPADWGPDTILVIDSLTMMAKAAFEWREPLTPGFAKGKYDKRAVYGDAQGAIEDVLAGITAEAFRSNVIVISHVRYMETEGGLIKGHPTAVGAALGTVIPRYFNSVALAQTVGGKRTIQTQATDMIDLKNPRPFEMLPKYDIGEGLAAFFAVLREPPTQEGQPKPKSLTLKRA